MLIIRNTIINPVHIKCVKVIDNYIRIEYDDSTSEKFYYDCEDEADKAFYDITQVLSE